ncbi:MAG: polysaccharide biosynthesis C-terminal domain-containing protein [Bacteroidota bacterium]
MLLKRFSYSVITRGIVAFINFLILIISSRYLGADTRGQISLVVLNIANIQMISEIFTGYTLVHFVPKYSLRKIFYYGILWIIILEILGLWILYQLNYLVKNYEVELAISSFMVILNTFCMVIILAKENIRLYNWMSILQPLVLLAVLAFNIFVERVLILDAYFDALFFSFGLALVVNVCTVVQYLKKDSNVDFQFGNIISNGFLSQWSNWMHLLSNRFSYYVLSAFYLNWLGIYSTATSLVESVFVIYSGISTVVLSYVSNEEDKTKSRQITIRAALGSFLLTLLALLILLLIPEQWIIWVLGKGFANIKLPMMILSIGALAISFSAVFSHYFSAIGVLKYNAISNTFACLFTVLFSHLFIQKWGISGSAWIGSISYLIEAIFVSYFFMRKEKVKWREIWSVKNWF